MIYPPPLSRTDGSVSVFLNLLNLVHYTPCCPAENISVNLWKTISLALSFFVPSSIWASKLCVSLSLFSLPFPPPWPLSSHRLSWDHSLSPFCQCVITDVEIWIFILVSLSCSLVFMLSLSLSPSVSLFPFSYAQEWVLTPVCFCSLSPLSCLHRREDVVWLRFYVLFNVLPDHIL